MIVVDSSVLMVSEERDNDVVLATGVICVISADSKLVKFIEPHPVARSYPRVTEKP